MRKQLNKGFTLIEIMIVVIIIGVLAVLALPRITAQIDVSKAAEAYTNLGALMRNVQQCYSMASNTADMTECDTEAELSGYSLPTSNYFTYTFNATTCGALTACTATATLKSSSAGVITFTFNATAGTIAKGKTGVFSALKN